MVRSLFHLPAAVFTAAIVATVDSESVAQKRSLLPMNQRTFGPTAAILALALDVAWAGDYLLPLSRASYLLAGTTSVASSRICLDLVSMNTLSFALAMPRPLQITGLHAFRPQVSLYLRGGLDCCPCETTAFQRPPQLFKDHLLPVLHLFTRMLEAETPKNTYLDDRALPFHQARRASAVGSLHTVVVWLKLSKL